MNMARAKERLKELIITCNKGIEMYPYDRELFLTDRQAIETVLQELDNKDKRIIELENKLENINEYINNMGDK